ncbi:MAG TPA: hypothetical protein VFE84_01145 [Patescibacteria group bacterium]|jgi:hypothetical protein|nr:hypothetical protein [Patescibacteria group bacterium]
MMIILTGVVAAAAALFVLSPLLGWGGSPAFETTTPAGSREQELLRQRQETLASIKDLEMEYEVGKLTKEDFDQTRERLSQQAIEIYRQMDRHARG